METGIISSMPINEIELKDMPLSTRLSVIDDGIRKKYLARLSEMQIAPIKNLQPLEDDLISNIADNVNTGLKSASEYLDEYYSTHQDSLDENAIAMQD